MKGAQKRILAIVLTLLLAVGILPTGVVAASLGPDTSSSTVTIDLPIQSALDDMEEWLTQSGALDDSSSDLEIGVESPGDADPEPQLVGLRFAGLNIPQGAQIINAYIQFTSDSGDDDKNTDPLDITITAQDADNAAPFTTDNYTLSSRTTMSSLWRGPRPTGRRSGWARARPARTSAPPT